ncbi:helix-turn-helix domain-containing protein [Dactylosporangium sp. CS-047395]|uniref:helix-turn-helix domain-containing protein n=1 Tax=Dactylosporangium sp. CS-047395 TaxID=3239936 RepID=UPI003D93827C
MSQVGVLIRRWRTARGLSQLGLSAAATVSLRHLSFIETGRAGPSRAMVLKLAEVLDVPLRERNELLLAAGFAPVYRETPLDGPELDEVRAALEAILAQQEPYPALVMDRDWNIRHSNAAAARFFAFLRAGHPEPVPGPPNVLRRLFHPDGVRRYVTNWPLVGEALVRRVRREAIGGSTDERAGAILREILSYPGVPASLRTLDVTVPTLPVVPIRYARDGRRFHYFSTVTTLGTAQDITLQELRIECFFPADDETRANARALRDAAVSAPPGTTPASTGPAAGRSGPAAPPGADR